MEDKPTTLSAFSAKLGCFIQSVRQDVLMHNAIGNISKTDADSVNKQPDEEVSTCRYSVEHDILMLPAAGFGGRNQTVQIRSEKT
mmetsp:Transcript_4998/g.8916  ORF Transcript_4998/g.8916 Transcript_4998/m.8916 type:complete len:85 (-) Transcript_4998:13-267(-)